MDELNEDKTLDFVLEKNNNGKKKLVGPLIFRKTKFSYSKVCQLGTGGSDSGHQAAETAAAQLN